MELHDDVNRGGLCWLRDVVEELSLEVREGWNMEREWVSETLALFPNMAMLAPVWPPQHWVSWEADWEVVEDRILLGQTDLANIVWKYEIFTAFLVVW